MELWAGKMAAAASRGLTHANVGHRPSAAPHGPGAGGRGGREGGDGVVRRVQCDGIVTFVLVVTRTSDQTVPG